MANIRIGLFLSVAAVSGAIIGAFLAPYVRKDFLFILLGVLLIFSLGMSFKEKTGDKKSKISPVARQLQLSGNLLKKDNSLTYVASRVKGGFLLMVFAGALSDLLGIGSGALKVLAMDNTMRLPFKVSTGTSNFMMGITALGSALIYYQRGYMDVILCIPVVIGVSFGAFTGSKILLHTSVGKLKIIFAAVILFLALEMIYKGLSIM